MLHVPFVLLWILWSFRGHRGRSLLLLAVFVGGMALSVGPWTVHNALRYDRFLLIDTNAGNVLHNNWSAIQGENYDIGLLKAENRPLVFETRRQSRRPRVKEANIVDRNNAEIRAAINFALRRPTVVLRHAAIRAAEFVNPTSFLVRNLRTGGYAGLADWVREVLVVAVLVTTMAALVMGVFGLAARPANEEQLLLLLLIVSHTLSAVAIISMSRYRLPIMPFLLLFASHAGLHFKSYLAVGPNRSRWIALAIAAPFLLGSWVLYVPYSFP